jgi:hypothetical protein
MLKPSERQALIGHELAHIHRKDPLIRVLEGLARICFFFFPPVLWVCRRREHFSEMACDRWAISISGVEPSDYAGALIKMIKEVQLFPQAVEGLPLMRGVKPLERRIRYLLREDLGRSSPYLSPALKGIFICWALFVLAGGAQSARFEGRTEISSANHVRTLPDASFETNEPGGSAEGKHAKENDSPETLAQKGHPARQRPVRLEEVYSNQELAAAERKGYESEPQQDEVTQAGTSGLSQFEEGYLAGSRLARERPTSTPPATTGGEVDRARLRSDGQLRREIEMRALERQHLSRPPNDR